MNILVTGATGFLGRHVVDLLKTSDHVFHVPGHQILDLLSTPPGEIEISLFGWDIDAIIHLAATCGGIGINEKNPGRFIYENLQMGINILEAARIGRVKKFINISTVCSYPKYTQVPFKEEDIWLGYPEETNAPYGIAKKSIVEMGIAYSKQYGINVTNLVPTNMAGEYDNFNPDSSHVIPAIIRKFEEANGEPITLWGTGSASREFLYAGDCARAILIALDKNTGPDPINLGTGTEITIAELVKLVKRCGQYKSEIMWDATKPDGQPRRCLDTTRAKNALRWEAQTSLEDTITRSINWYRNNK